MLKKSDLWVALLVLLPALAGAAAQPPQGREIQVNTNPLGSHSGPLVAVFPDGGFVVAWTVGRDVIHARFFARDGEPTSGEFRLIDRAAGSQFADGIVADRDGSFLLVWTEEGSPNRKYSVYVRRFSRNGAPLGRRIRVHNPSPLDRRSGVLALAPNGRFAVGWTSDVEPPDSVGYLNATARIFNRAGDPITDEILIATGDEYTNAYPTGLTLDSRGSLTVLYQTNEEPSDIYNWLAHFPARGTPSQLRLHLWPDSYGGSSLVMDRNGQRVAAWGQWEVMAQRFASNGAPRGEAFWVSKRPATDIQANPGIAPLADGRFVVVWAEAGGRDGDGWGIFGRIFAMDGTPVSRDLRINLTTASHQYAPKIAAGRTGPVIVVWQQQRSEDGKSDVFARVMLQQ